MMLTKGDPCPCCGMPISTDDPMILKILTDIAERKSAKADNTKTNK